MGTNFILRPIIFLIFLGYIGQGFASTKVIEMQGSYISFSSQNNFNLHQIENTAIWQNSDDMIKAHFIESETSLSDFYQLTQKNIHEDANRFILDNNLTAPTDSKLLTTKTLLSNTEYNEFIVLGGNEKHAFKFTLSAPSPLSKRLKHKIQDLLNEFHWEHTNPSMVEGLPFTLQKLAGFTVTHKFANSVMLKSDASNESLDAYIIISFLEEKSSNTSLEERTTAIIHDAKSLNDIEIGNITSRQEYSTPVVLARVSAKLSSNDKLVDILHASQLHDSNLLLVQIMVDKTSVSFLKLEDMAKKVLNSIHIK